MDWNHFIMKYIIFPLLRYPRQVSPWLNLVKLLTPISWTWTFASLLATVLCFNISSIVVKWMGMKLTNVEIDLYPLRWLKIHILYDEVLKNCYFRVYFPYTSAVQRGKARVPTRTNLLSFNTLWLMWAVCGGVGITNFLLGNYMAVLVDPVFEKPVETAQVIL